MKSMLKGFLCITLLASFGAALGDASDGSGDCNDCCTTTSQKICGNQCDSNCEKGDVYGKTFFALRPQDSNEAFKMMATEDKIHLFGKEEFYGMVSLGINYGRTFKSRDLAHYFSFVEGQTSMTYGDACDGSFDIYGLNFGTTASGTICLEPKIQNILVQPDFFVGLDELICGLWARIILPINWTRWEFNVKDTFAPSGEGSSTYPAGQVLLAGSASSDTVVYNNLRAGWINDQPFGDVPKLSFGKLACDKTTDTQVAGLHFDLGYDWVRKEKGHFATSVHFVAPTGTRPEGRFLFEAVSGACHMWQLGGTVNAGYQLWENCDGDQRFSAYFDATVTHLFSSKQRRVLGLKTPDGDPNPGASWMLLKKIQC